MDRVKAVPGYSWSWALRGGARRWRKGVRTSRVACRGDGVLVGFRSLAAGSRLRRVPRRMHGHRLGRRLRREAR